MERVVDGKGTLDVVELEVWFRHLRRLACAPGFSSFVIRPLLPDENAAGPGLGRLHRLALKVTALTLSSLRSSRFLARDEVDEKDL